MINKNTLVSLVYTGEGTSKKIHKKDYWLIRFPVDCAKHLFLFNSSCQYFLSPIPGS